ncbi:MAG: SGNH/GDSL hydrolase family protein [Rikenellaceae bacterium]|nr:SGNH/GDSL hydrolase family protein [Rikenellaceae bacterium]
MKHADIKITKVAAALLACWAALFSAPVPARAAAPFSDDTRTILFLGNSITYAGTYIADLETYFLVRYPDRRYRWINCGLPSETASGLSEEGHAGGAFPRPDVHARADRVMEAVRPDVVFVCYGMNDGIYLPLDQERFAAYRDGMVRLDSMLRAYGPSEVIYLTPPVHDDARQGLEGYNLVLDAYSDWLLSQAAGAGWRVIDLHYPMKEHLLARRSRDPDYRLAGDGVHPQAEGHWLMARSILAGLGETAVSGKPDIITALPECESKEEIYRLVCERQAVMKDAWLAHTGHDRPRMKPGLPLEEAEHIYGEMEVMLDGLLGLLHTGDGGTETGL